MSGLLEYSGITTKIRSMIGSLFNDQDYKRIMASASVYEAVQILKQKPVYNSLFSSVDENMIHRGNIEKLLIKAIFIDFEKLYRFSNLNHRKYLKLYIKKYEINILKKGLRMAFDQKSDSVSIQLYKDFFDRYSQIDISLLSSSKSVQDFVMNLKGTEYYTVLNKLGNIDNPQLFDYEMSLDLYYFKTLWKHKDKILTNEDLKTFTEDQGSKIDMLNIQWIYRTKKYYNMSNTDIYTMLIPIHYKLKKEDIASMVEASDENEFAYHLKNTYYAKHYSELTAQALENFYDLIRNKIQNRQIKTFPYSIAIINNYLYKKEKEVDKLTTVLECIRYHIEPAKIYEYISESKNNGKRQGGYF